MKITAITRRSVNGEIPAYYPGWLRTRFGDCFAQISADTTLKIRSAVKDVSRACRRKCDTCDEVFETKEHMYACTSCGGTRVVGFVAPDIEALAKLFLSPPQGVDELDFILGSDSDVGHQKGSAEKGHDGTDQALVTYIERYPDDWAIAQKALGLSRQKTRHACAYVIGNTPIHEKIPIMSVGGVPVTAFTAPEVEAVGGLKMDFLNLNSLRDMQFCLALIRSKHPVPDDAKVNGIRVPRSRLVLDPISGELADIWDLPSSIPVFESICSSRTETVFQFNTPAAKKWLSHFAKRKADGSLAISSVADMAVFTALDRPGPLDIYVTNPDWTGPKDAPAAKHNMLVEFARRARGDTPSPDVLPVLDRLVPETYGVMCYQEQLQRVYQNITGCSATEAEQFRTDVAKKKKAKVDAARPGFIDAASKQMSVEDAERLWEFIETWAQYGFNKSHAVCYAALGYATAWLKHHYPLEWWCSVLTNASKEEIASTFWPYCADKIRLPSLDVKADTWTITADGMLQAPISLLHGVGEKAHLQIGTYAPYTSIQAVADAVLSHRESGISRVTKQRKQPDGTIEEYETDALGRSAISRSLIFKLALAGAFDFTGLSVPAIIDTYDDAIVSGALARAASSVEFKKIWKAAANSYRNAAKKGLPMLDALGRYQAKKDLIPAFGCDIGALLGVVDPPLKREGQDLVMVGSRWNPARGRTETTTDYVVGMEQLQLLNSDQNVPQNGYKCAIVAYVNDLRKFSYQQGTKTAISFSLEVGGRVFEFVSWPDKNGQVEAEAAAIQAGSIVAASLFRNAPERGFSIRKIHCIRPPFGAIISADE